MRIKPNDSIRDLHERDVQTAENVFKLLIKTSDDDFDVKHHQGLAEEFHKSESTTRDFHIGSANWDTRHILYLIWVAGIYLCSGCYGNQPALLLLEKAVSDLRKEIDADVRTTV
jgi:hypothetical protein